jgi:probable HAF family extracellular repeat protein
MRFLSLQSLGAAALVLGSVGASAVQTPTYHIVDLGPNFDPSGINDRGEIVAFDKREGVLKRGRWRPLPPYSFPIGPTAINDRGDVAGASPDTVGFWPRGGEFMPVPLPPDATGSGTAADISDHQVIVGSFFRGYARRACYRWSAAEGSVDLGWMGSGDVCNAYAINDSGQIVGEANIEPGGPVHAFLYENGAFRDLGMLDGYETIAMDVNRRGHIMGVTTSRTSFLWKNGKMIDLRAGTPYSVVEAVKMNDRDEIVGQVFGPEGSQTVLISGGHFIVLETAVDALHDWQLNFVRSINNLGEIIGNGFRTGDQRNHSFLLVPLP